MSFVKIFLVLFTVGFLSCNSNKAITQTEDEGGIAKAIEGKVLVTLLEGKKIETLEASFVKYVLKHKSIASRSQNQHLFTFDKNTISSEDLIRKLNKNKIVYLAEVLKYNIGQPEQFTSSKKGKAVVK